MHQITSRLNFAVYDSLLDFWCPSSITRVYGISAKILGTVYDHISAGYTAGTFCYKTRRYLDVPVDSNAWQIARGFVQGMVTVSPTLVTYHEKVMKGPLLHSIAK